MAKNKLFKRQYIIEFKGTTTNNFMEEFLDRTLQNFIDTFCKNFQSVSVERFDTTDISNKENKRNEKL